MSEGESGRDGDRTPQATAKRVPCLHNPGREELDLHLKGRDFVWIDLEDPTTEDLERVSAHIPLHPLTLKDARDFRQRPKLEDFDDYLFMVVYGVDAGTAAGDPLLREVHLIISGEAVVTLHRRPDRGLADLRERWSDRAVRSEQFFVYTILEAIVSTFVPVLSRVEDSIDELEDRVLDRPSEAHLQEIFSIKRDLVAMRRVITPMRDILQRNADRIAELRGLDTDDRFYFRDLHDELVRTSEMVDAYRDLLSGATDLYQSTVANRQGEVNRQLTIIATIFLPLTFFTGFFGQNFGLLVDHIINREWSFWVFGVGLLVASVLGFWWYFHRQGWIGVDATGGDPDDAHPRRSRQRSAAQASDSSKT